jgi:hypothetical protein
MAMKLIQLLSKPGPLSNDVLAALLVAPAYFMPHVKYVHY